MRVPVDPGFEVNLVTIRIADYAGCGQLKAIFLLIDVGGDIFRTAECSTTLQIFPGHGGTLSLSTATLTSRSAMQKSFLKCL